MEKELELGRKLSRNEKGQLQGGYELQDYYDVRSQLCTTNTNCKGGGLFDTNTNCGDCSACNGGDPTDVKP